MTTKEVTILVLKFLQDSNRPWSLNDILEKCGKDHGKSAIQKSIDSLVSKDEIVEKLFGKHKIFYVKQKHTNDKENKSETSQLERKFENIRNDLKTNEEKMQKLELELKKFNKIPSISNLETERTELLAEIEKNTNILTKMKTTQQSKDAKSKLFTSEDIKKIDNCHEKVSTEFRKRKRMCNEMIDSIMEGYPNTKRQLIEEVGIETDENVGFKLENC